jgi:hypothetical protein
VITVGHLGSPEVTCPPERQGKLPLLGIVGFGQYQDQNKSERVLFSQPVFPYRLKFRYHSGVNFKNIIRGWKEFHDKRVGCPELTYTARFWAVNLLEDPRAGGE